MARLPERVAIAVAVYVQERLVADPYRRSKPLTGQLADVRGARNGDYRVLLTIDDHARVVHIVRVEHRAHAYRTH